MGKDAYIKTRTCARTVRYELILGPGGRAGGCKRLTVSIDARGRRGIGENRGGKGRLYKKRTCFARKRRGVVRIGRHLGDRARKERGGTRDTRERGGYDVKENEMRG